MIGLTLSSYDQVALRDELTCDEGNEARAYRCPAGYWTVGIGHNLEAKPLSATVRAIIFEDDVRDAEQDLDVLIPRWRELPDANQRVLVNMSFQLGRDHLAGFRKFLGQVHALIVATTALERATALDAGVREMLDSKWAREDSPARARRLAARWIGL